MNGYTPPQREKTTRPEHPRLPCVDSLTDAGKSLVRALAVAVVSVAVLSGPSTASADHPSPVDRLGRYLGVGWGDGYHLCRDCGKVLRRRQARPPIGSVTHRRRGGDCDAGPILDPSTPPEIIDSDPADTRIYAPLEPVPLESLEFPSPSPDAPEERPGPSLWHDPLDLGELPPNWGPDTDRSGESPERLARRRVRMNTYYGTDSRGTSKRPMRIAVSTGQRKSTDVPRNWNPVRQPNEAVRP
jgi:hypothetical protein